MRKARKEYEEKGLDLVPIMNLVTILIPFLLMSAQFVTLAVIDTTLPAISSEAQPVDPEDKDEDKLNLSILITSEGYTLTGADEVLPKDDEENGPNVPCLENGCPTAESYDYAALTKKLVTVKNRWPDEQNAILVPETKVPYEVVVLTMDASRNDPEDVDQDTNKARDLFPFVVIAAGVN